MSKIMLLQSVLILIVLSLCVIPWNFENSLAMSNTSIPLVIDGEDYSIDYIVTNGTVRGADVNHESKTMKIHVIPFEDGKLVLQLPRFVIDSKDSTEIDRPFIVTLYETTGGSEKTTIIDVTETRNTEEARTLSIDFTKDTLMIEIQGTYLVPEFGTFGIFIALLSMSAIIVIARIKMNQRAAL